MDSQVLKCADNIKYLGFTFSSDQKDDNDILRQLRMLYTKSNRLLRLFHHCCVDIKLARYFATSVLVFIVPSYGHITKNRIIVSFG